MFGYYVVFVIMHYFKFVIYCQSHNYKNLVKHGLHALSAMPKSTQPSTICGMIKCTCFWG